MRLPKEIQDLNELLSRLPNIGPKLSSRLALYLALGGKDLAKKISVSINEVLENIKVCQLCGNVSNTDICDICSDESRDRSQILVVEDSLDLYNIESSAEYTGLYHILGGVISPINGIGPSDLRILGLLNRAREPEPKEIILALNPNLEGDATSLYIKQEIQKINSGIAITRLAKGIPAGGDIEFVSNQTIVDSMRSRREF